MKFKRVIAVVNDTHIGSKGALFPKGFKDDEDRVIMLNRAQGKLLDYWYFFCGVCDELKVDTVLLLGDLVHGNNRKEFGRGVITSSLDEQKEACFQLLEPFCKNRAVHGLCGTGYHDSIDVNLEREIIGRLGGRYYGVFMNLRIKGTDRTIHASHGASTAYIYPEMVLGRKAMFAKEAEALGKVDKFDIILQGHSHKFLHVHKRDQHIIVNPCWQVLVPSRFTAKAYFKFQPDIGACLLLFDEANRIHVWHYLMPKAPKLSDRIRSV